MDPTYSVVEIQSLETGWVYIDMWKEPLPAGLLRQHADITIYVRPWASKWTKRQNVASGLSAEEARQVVHDERKTVEDGFLPYREYKAEDPPHRRERTGGSTPDARELDRYGARAPGVAGVRAGFFADGQWRILPHGEMWQLWCPASGGVVFQGRSGASAMSGLRINESRNFPSARG